MLDIASRRKACEDTIRRTPTIAAYVKGEGSSSTSTFIPSQLAALDKSSSLYPDLTLKPIVVHNSDAFALARALAPTRGKVGVQNLASDREPGGGWRYTLSTTQEEALCYSSTLYATLNPEWYPFPNTGPGSCAAIVSPNVVVFKDTLERDLVDLPTEKRHVVDVITISAPCFPKITDDRQNFAQESELQDLREKIVLTLRLAATNGVTNLVLGAMGCGAYGCPPRAVAREMRNVLGKEEFSGWFETIVFAVYASGPSGKLNLDSFTEVFNSP
jgi:uncharacterized protein (TIGR02452 family)